VTAPAFDDDLGFAQRVEDLAVEQLIAQASVETLDKPVLPRAARRDVGGLCSDRTDPLLYCLGEEFRAVVGTDVLWNATQDEQIDLPPEKWTPGYADLASACSGVMYPIAEWRRCRL
jgi:hypothetical protein